MAALERLLQQLENPSEVAWNEETYDLADCSCLTDDEKAAFADKLLAAAHAGDTRALLTLGFIGAPGASGQELFALAGSTDPLAAVARRAMVQLGRGQELVEQIANDAQHSPSNMLRIAAVMMLAKLDGPAAKAALLAALTDVSDTVRSTAWDGIIAQYKLKPQISDPEGVRQLQTYIEIWGGYLLCDAKAFIQLGADEMRWIVRYLDAGTPPATLGIAWKPEEIESLMQTFRLALLEDEEPFPIDAMFALTGFERRSCETLLAYRLEKFDLRGVHGLVALKAAWATPIIEELAQDAQCPPDVSAAMKAACETLSPLGAPTYISAYEQPENPIEPYVQALASALGSPVLVEYDNEIGNPRDGFWRDATLTGYRPPGHLAGPPLRIVVKLVQDLWFSDKPQTGLRGIEVYGDRNDPAVAMLQTLFAANAPPKPTAAPVSDAESPRVLYPNKYTAQTIEPYQQALAKALGTDVLVEYGTEVGNPRDGSWREATLTASRPAPPLRVVMSFGQDLYDASNSRTDLRVINVYGAKTDPAVTTLIAELASIGCEMLE